MTIFATLKPNLAQLPTPGEKAKIEKTENTKFTIISSNRLKPQINQPTVIHSITPNTHNL